MWRKIVLNRYRFDACANNISEAKKEVYIFYIFFYTFTRRSHRTVITVVRARKFTETRCLHELHIHIGRLQRVQFVFFFVHFE